MDCMTCGYYWADLDKDGRPITSEYCHFDGPDEWAPCEQDSNNEYANEADIEAREAEEEAAYEAWLESLPMEQRPTNAKEYVEAWKHFQARYEEDKWLAEMEQAIYDEDYRSSVEYYGEPYDYQEF